MSKFKVETGIWHKGIHNQNLSTIFNADPEKNFFKILCKISELYHAYWHLYPPHYMLSHLFRASNSQRKFFIASIF